MAYVLVVRMTAREGEEERAAQLIAQLAASSQQEPGNVQWIAHRSVPSGDGEPTSAMLGGPR